MKDYTSLNRQLHVVMSVLKDRKDSEALEYLAACPEIHASLIYYLVTTLCSKLTVPCPIKDGYTLDSMQVAGIHQLLIRTEHSCPWIPSYRECSLGACTPMVETVGGLLMHVSHGVDAHIANVIDGSMGREVMPERVILMLHKTLRYISNMTPAWSPTYIHDRAAQLRTQLIEIAGLIRTTDWPLEVTEVVLRLANMADDSGVDNTPTPGDNVIPTQEEKDNDRSGSTDGWDWWNEFGL